MLTHCLSIHQFLLSLHCATAGTWTQNLTFEESRDFLFHHGCFFLLLTQAKRLLTRSLFALSKTLHHAWSTLCYQIFQTSACGVGEIWTPVRHSSDSSGSRASLTSDFTKRCYCQKHSLCCTWDLATHASKSARARVDLWLSAWSVWLTLAISESWHYS